MRVIISFFLIFITSSFFSQSEIDLEESYPMYLAWEQYTTNWYLKTYSDSADLKTYDDTINFILSTHHEMNGVRGGMLNPNFPYEGQEKIAELFEKNDHNLYLIDSYYKDDWIRKYRCLILDYGTIDSDPNTLNAYLFISYPQERKLDVLEISVKQANKYIQTILKENKQPFSQTYQEILEEYNVDFITQMKPGKMGYSMFNLTEKLNAKLEKILE